MSCSINLILEDRIVFILTLTWGDDPGVYNAFPELFELREDGKYYWKNQEAQYKFYDLFNSDEYVKLPETVRLMRKTIDTIISTLQINENGFAD